MKFLKELTEARYAQSKKLPLALVKLFKKYFELEDEIDETGYGEWYPLDGVTARYDKNEGNREDYNNEVGSISGPDRMGQFTVHDTYSGDGPYVPADDLLKYLYFETRRI